MVDRDVLDMVEREIADEVRTRFPGDAVQRVRLLQCGDHPMMEPGTWQAGTAHHHHRGRSRRGPVHRRQLGIDIGIIQAMSRGTSA